MGSSQYCRQHNITYHGYKYSLPSVAGFIRQSGDYYLFPRPEISGRQGSERVKDWTIYWSSFTADISLLMAPSVFILGIRRSRSLQRCQSHKKKAIVSS